MKIQNTKDRTFDDLRTRNLTRVCIYIYYLMINFKKSDRKIFIKNVHNCSSLLEDHEIFFVRTNQSKI